MYQWGDERISWQAINDAGNWISDEYIRRSGSDFFSWKEKYGTIRYEFLHIALKSTNDLILLCEIVHEAALKWPQIDALIVHDLRFTMDEKSENPRVLEYIDIFKEIEKNWTLPEGDIP